MEICREELQEDASHAPGGHAGHPHGNHAFCIEKQSGLVEPHRQGGERQRARAEALTTPPDTLLVRAEQTGLTI